MGLISDLKSFKIGDSEVYLWNHESIDIEQYYHILNSQEYARFKEFKHPNRRRDYIATRLLFNHLFQGEKIRYNENRAPFIENGPQISISHCSNIAAIALNHNHEIGLDIEFPRNKVIQLYRKFLSEDEVKHFNTSDVNELTKVWSAKEALYKLSGRKGIIFKEELLLSKQDPERWIGQIIGSEKTILVKLNIFESDGLIISINNEAPRHL